MKEISQQVHPLSGTKETLWMAIIAVLIITVQLAYVRYLGHEEYQEQIFDWQVSAFNSFEGADQAIYNALYTVKDEIPYIYDDINRFNEPDVKFRWPNLEDFQEYYLSPFYQDNSWIQNGSVAWSLYEPLAEGEMQGYSMYLGTSGSQPNQGSFLLTIGHVHAGMQNNNALDIWWHPNQQIIMPTSGFKDSLIRDGWKYVVAHSGDKEIKRIFGE